MKIIDKIKLAFNVKFNEEGEPNYETRDAIEIGRCVICDKLARIFRSEKYLREYDKIGYCQECQDEILGE